MADYLKQSEAESRGEVVTTVSNYGGIGLGRLVDGVVYYSGGNGFYYPKEKDMGGMKEYHRDGGQGYRDRVNSLCLPPGYKTRTKKQKRA